MEPIDSLIEKGPDLCLFFVCVCVCGGVDRFRALFAFLLDSDFRVAKYRTVLPDVRLYRVSIRLHTLVGPSLWQETSKIKV